MVYGCPSHNFIDLDLVERINFPIETFEGFVVTIPGNKSMECTRWIPKLQVTIGDYTLLDSFYVVNVVNTNLVLGVQWLYSIGDHSMNYQVPQIIFKLFYGKQVIL